MKKKFVAVIAVVVIVAVIVSLAYFGSIPVLSAAVHGQSKVLIVQSASMAPAIKQGASIVYDDTVAFNDLKVDDVIIFRGDGYTMVARIIRVSTDGLQVKGDANTSPYPNNVTQTMYTGKVVRIDNPP